jgi:hypothetical protein
LIEGMWVEVEGKQSRMGCRKRSFEERKGKEPI